MIILRYLVKQVFKGQLATLFILLLIFFCQNLVRILSAAVDGNVPTNLIFSLLTLGIPEMAQLILPLSLFLAVLMIYGKLYVESEITVMHACGIGKERLLSAVMILAVFTALVATVNNAWLNPWSITYQEQLLANAKANPNLAGIVEGQFQQSNDGQNVLYIGNVNKGNIENIFIAQLKPNNNQQPSIIVSDKGTVRQLNDGSQVVNLDQGTRYEGTAQSRNFRVTDFNNYEAMIGYQDVNVNDADDTEQMNMHTLFKSNDPKAKIELHWRLILIVSIPLMALLVVPLSYVNPRQGRTVSMLPAILLYLIFFLLESSLKSNGFKGTIKPISFMWTICGVYLLLGIILNLWDTLMVRRIRARLKGAKAC